MGLCRSGAGNIEWIAAEGEEGQETPLAFTLCSHSYHTSAILPEYSEDKETEPRHYPVTNRGEVTGTFISQLFQRALW